MTFSSLSEFGGRACVLAEQFAYHSVPDNFADIVL
jgi:hypothetical protein